MRHAIALVIALSTILPLRADDWPQWMGPQRDNIWREKGILDAFPTGGPKVLWRAPVSNGYSGPAVADGLVVLTDFVPSESVLDKDNFDREKFKGKDRVLCFEAQTGKEKWKYEYGCVNNVSYPNGPRCTPVISAGKVYTLGAVGNLICFESKTGKQLWSRDFVKDYEADIPLWGFAAHPLIDGNRLICLVGGKGSVAVALDKDTGKEIWKALTATQPGYSPPSIIEAGGTRQLIIWHPESLNSLNPETGAVYWSVKQQTANGTSIMTPRKLGDYLFIGAWQHKARLLKLDTDKPGATDVWKGNRDTSRISRQQHAVPGSGPHLRRLQRRRTALRGHEERRTAVGDVRADLRQKGGQRHCSYRQARGPFLLNCGDGPSGHRQAHPGKGIHHEIGPLLARCWSRRARHLDDSWCGAIRRLPINACSPGTTRN